MKIFWASIGILNTIAIVNAGFSPINLNGFSAKSAPVPAKPATQPSSFQLPRPRGPYAIGTTSYYLVDAARKETYPPEAYDIRTQKPITTPPPTDRRELMIYVWYPAKADAKASPAPYIDAGFALATAESFGPAFGVAPDVFVKLITQSAHTNSLPKALPALSKGRYPVVILSPGFGSTPKWHTAQIEQLVSQGFVVVGVNPTYEAPVLVPDGRLLIQASVFDLKNAGKEAEFRTFNEATAIRASDVRFVLNELQRINAKDTQGLLTGRLDLSRIGIIGHSLGANTAVEAMRTDPRIKAAISMDCGEYGELFRQESKERLSRPLMVMSREKLERWSQLLYQRGTRDTYLLKIEGSVHATFSDYGLLLPLFAAHSTEAEPPVKQSVGSISPERASRIISTYTVAFFGRYLKNWQISFLDDASLEYPEVLIESRQ